MKKNENVDKATIQEQIRILNRERLALRLAARDRSIIRVPQGYNLIKGKSVVRDVDFADGIVKALMPAVLDPGTGQLQQTRPSSIEYTDGAGLNDETDYEPLRKDAEKIREVVPEAQQTPAERAILIIDEARTTAMQRNSTDGNRVIEELPPRLQKLIDQRYEILGNEKNYRKSDGQLLAAKAKQLESIDRRISNAANEAGYSGVLAGETRAAPKTFAESQEQSREETALNREPRYTSLSESESALLESLLEKEAFEGLTIKEADELSRLIDKRNGVKEAERVPLTKKEKEELKKINQSNLGESQRTRGGKVVSVEKLFSEDGPTLDLGVNETEDFVLGENDMGLPKNMAKDLQIEQIIAQFFGQFKSKPRVIARDMSQFENDPSLSSEDIENLRGPGLAAYSPSKNTVYIRNDKLKTASELMRVLLHESVGHFGIRNLFISKAQEESFLTWVDKSRRLPNMIQELQRTHPSLFDVSHAAMWRMGKPIATNPAFESMLVQWRTYTNEVTQTTYIVNHLGTGTIRLEADGSFSTIGTQFENPNGQEPTRRMGFATIEEAIEYAERDLSLLAAEEYIAEQAETETGDVSFMKRVIAWMRRNVLRHILPKMQATDADIKALLASSRVLMKTGRRMGVFPQLSVGSSISNGVKHLLMSEGVTKSAREQTLEDMGMTPDDIGKQIDSLGSIWGAKAASGILTPLQFTERFGQNTASRKYMGYVQRWWARKRRLTIEPTEIATDINSYSPKDQDTLAKLIFQVSAMSEEKGRRLLPKELEQVFKRMDIGTDMQKTWQKVDGSFLKVLDQLEKGLEISAIRNAYPRGTPMEKIERIWSVWRDAGSATNNKRKAFNSMVNDQLGNLELIPKLNAVRDEVGRLRNLNYFPRMRFGKWALSLRDPETGKLTWFETFETRNERETTAKALLRQGKYKDADIQRSLMSEEEFSFLAMPPQMLDTLKSQLNLTGEQQEQLKELYYLRSPGRSFLRHLVKREGVPGFSKNVLRAYSTYMMNSSNHIARIEFHQDMQEALGDLYAMRRDSPNADKLTVVYDYYQRHFDYIMNPGNDLAKLRAMGFLWYLGFNVKSAAVNLTQVPMVAYPMLASQYGDFKSVGAISGAYKTVIGWRTKGEVLDPEMRAAVERGIEEGFLDESHATVLAGLSESGALKRLIPSTTTDKVINDVSYYGAYLFQHAEKFNREVTFVAARQLALDKGATTEEAFRAGRKAVQSAMFEYAKWNRPGFMRGKKSVFFLFWQYMQHLSFISFGGEGKGAAMRTWAMLMLAAGFQGLPFMENILDILDFGSTRVKELLGMDDPKTELRDDIRELTLSLTNSPDTVMHGLSRSYGLGAFHLLEAFGWDVPSVDVSGSLSAGRMIPGTDSFLGNEKDPNAKFGRTVAEAGGPVLGVPFAIWKAMQSNDPDTWKTWERALPVAIQSGSKALRRGMRGEESYRGGGAVAKFDPHNMHDRIELISQALGFSTTRVNQRLEQRNSQEDMKRYYTLRRTLVLENYAYAIMTKDKAAIDASLKAIRTFNKTVPAKGAAIGFDTLVRSIKQRYQARSLREQGRPREDFFVRDFIQKSELYPVGRLSGED